MYLFHEAQDRKRGVNPGPRDFRGITKRWRWLRRHHRTGRWRLRNNIGCILLTAQTGAGTVSHEMTHAAIGWATHRGFRLGQISPEVRRTSGNPRAASRIEERICRVQGDLVRQFWNGYYHAIGLDQTMDRVGKTIANRTA